MTDLPFPREVDKNAIYELPLAKCPEPIYLITEPAEVPAAVAALRSEHLLGFDTETRPAFKKGQHFTVSLMQLCGTQATYLFRLHMVGFHPALKELLEAPDLLKVGVAIHEDLRALQRLSPFHPAGFVDLSKAVRPLKIKHVGLRNLAAIILGLRVSKSARVSNWENPELTPVQLNYAATDAWATRQIYVHLTERGLIPAHPEEAEEETD